MKKLGKVILIFITMLITFTCISGYFSSCYVLNRKNRVDYSDMNCFIVSNDNLNLAGEMYVQDIPTKKWVILVHSYGSSHAFMKEYAEHYQAEGYNTLAVDNRAHGVSEGNTIGMGYLDKTDVQSWIQYVLEQDQNAEIVLHGVSMGAAALMMLSGECDLPNNVVAIIEDSGYKSVEAYLSWKMKQKYNIPAFSIISITNIGFRIKAGYWLYAASAIDSVSRSNIPILFIHGMDDQTVPVNDVYDLYEAAGCKKELYIVDGAGHGEAMIKSPESYWGKVKSFLQECEANLD